MLLSCNCSITKITAYDLIFFLLFSLPWKMAPPPIQGQGGVHPPIQGQGGVHPPPHPTPVNPSLSYNI